MTDTRPNYEQLHDLLDGLPPTSSAELARMLGWTQMRVADSLRTLRRKHLVFIASYERQPDGQRGRCIPMYALGTEHDAPPLERIGIKEVNRKYRQRHAAILSARRYPQVRTVLGPWAGL